MKNTKSNLLSLLTAAAMMCSWLLCTPVQTAAAGTGSLKLDCSEDELVLDGMHWQLYSVGHNENGELALDGDYANRQINVTDTTASGMANIASTLRTIVKTENLPAAQEGTTNGEGVLYFTNLSDGVYLLLADNFTQDDMEYIASPILIDYAVDRDEELNVFPKIEYHTKTLSQEDVTFTVEKVWLNDVDTPRNRAVYITAGIYRNGELVENVRLSEENDWKYEWQGSKDDEWLVVEQIIPEGYVVEYTEQMTRYLIVNTFLPQPPDEVMTDVQTTTVATTAATTTTATTAAPSTTTATPNHTPFTGERRGYIPMLGVGAALAFGAAVVVRRKKDEE